MLNIDDDFQQENYNGLVAVPEEGLFGLQPVFNGRKIGSKGYQGKIFIRQRVEQPTGSIRVLATGEGIN